MERAASARGHFMCRHIFHRKEARCQHLQRAADSQRVKAASLCAVALKSRDTSEVAWTNALRLFGGLRVGGGAAAPARAPPSEDKAAGDS